MSLVFLLAFIATTAVNPVLAASAVHSEIQASATNDMHTEKSKRQRLMRKVGKAAAESSSDAVQSGEQTLQNLPPYELVQSGAHCLRGGWRMGSPGSVPLDTCYQKCLAHKNCKYFSHHTHGHCNGYPDAQCNRVALYKRVQVKDPNSVWSIYKMPDPQATAGQAPDGVQSFDVCPPKICSWSKRHIKSLDFEKITCKGSDCSHAHMLTKCCRTPQVFIDAARLKGICRTSSGSLQSTASLALSLDEENCINRAVAEGKEYYYYNPDAKSNGCVLSSLDDRTANACRTTRDSRFRGVLAALRRGTWWYTKQGGATYNLYQVVKARGISNRNICNAWEMKCRKAPESPYSKGDNGCVAFSRGWRKQATNRCHGCSRTDRDFKAGDTTECHALCDQLYRTRPGDIGHCVSGCTWMSTHSEGC